MKKGDIVKLKEGKTFTKAEKYGRSYSSYAATIPAFFTVKADAKYEQVGCGGEVSLMVAFEETHGLHKFYANCFDIVLPAGHPDIKELMKPVKTLQKA